MAKSQSLNFTQNLNTVIVPFGSNDPYAVIAVAANNAGSNLTVGTRTFTVANGTANVITAATFTATVTAVNSTANAITSIPVVTAQGSFFTLPTVTSNAPTVDSGSTNATVNLIMGPYKTIYTSNTNDAVVKSLNISSTDTAARVITFWLTDTTGNNYVLGAVSIPASSGTNGTAATVDALSGTLMPALPYDANGKRVLPLKAGYKLSASTPGTAPPLTVGTLMYVSAMIEEY